MALCHSAGDRSFAVLAPLVCVASLVAAAPAAAQGPGGPVGFEVQIRAENRSVVDLPICGIGGGAIGDRLRVDAFMNAVGVVTGRAVFEPAGGPPVDIDLDRAFIFFGGLLVQNQANQNTVPIFMSDDLAFSGFSPLLINVELPRGCANNQSTFTPGFDKVTMQIRFR